MQMRFTLQRAPAADAARAWRRRRWARGVAAAGRRHATSTTSGVANLQPPRAYRALVRFRWRDAAGTTSLDTRKTHAACRSPTPAPTCGRRADGDARRAAGHARATRASCATPAAATRGPVRRRAARSAATPQTGQTSAAWRRATRRALFARRRAARAGSDAARRRRRRRGAVDEADERNNTAHVPCPAIGLRARPQARPPLHWTDDEDRDPPRIRRGPRPLHVRQRVHDALDASPRSTSRSARTATRSTRAGRSWSTPAAGSSASSAAPPSARARRTLAHCPRRHEPCRDGRARRPARRARGRPGRPRGRDDARRLHVGGRRPQARRPRDPRAGARSRGGAHGEIESFPLTSVLRSHRAPAAAGHPRRRRARRVARRSASGRWASPPTPSSRRRRRRSPAACGPARSSSRSLSPSACSSSSRSGSRA